MVRPYHLTAQTI
jgi:hypothetical protein